MAGNQVTFFGVGDGWPCANRNHSATLYQLGGTTLLVDCGEPISRSYAASGLSYDAVDHILLSHMHGDHVGGFQMLIQGFWLKGRKKPLTVHMPRASIKPLRQMLKTGYLFEKLFGFKLTFRPLTKAKKLKLGGATVTPHPTTHLYSLQRMFQKQHRQPFDAFSFLIETPKVRIAHSADLGAPENLEPLLKKPVNLLVSELAHFAPRDLFAYLRGHSIRTIALTHLTEVLWKRKRTVLQQARAALPGKRISIPKDLEQMRV